MLFAPLALFPLSQPIYLSIYPRPKTPNTKTDGEQGACPIMRLAYRQPSLPTVSACLQERAYGMIPTNQPTEEMDTPVDCCGLLLWTAVRGCGLCRPHQACPVAVNRATVNGQRAARPPARAPISCVRREGLTDVARCTGRVRLISRCQLCALFLAVHIRNTFACARSTWPFPARHSLRPTY